MERNEIVIYVVGTTSSGKSTVSELISQKLNEIFENVEVINIDGDRDMVKQTLNNRVEALNSRGINIKIVETQAARKIINNNFNSFDFESKDDLYAAGYDGEI